MKICWFTTGRDKEAFTLLKDVCDAIDNRIIDGEIAIVFMNRDRNESDASDEVIRFVEQRNIPIELFSSKRFLDERGLKISEGRALFDAEVKSRIEKYDFDIIFLAGYMLILSKVLFEPYPVLNLHPSLPGAYKGKWEDVMKQAIEDGEKTFGAMIHMVDASLDEGPPIAYVKMKLEGSRIDELYMKAHDGDAASKDILFSIMREREFAIETPLIIQTLSVMSKGGIDIRDKKVYFQGCHVKGGADITEKVISR